MHQVPAGIAADYYTRCALELQRLDEQIAHTAAFIKSVLLSVNTDCFTAEESAALNGWLASVHAAREALR
jgi:hypothetical protein